MTTRLPPADLAFVCVFLTAFACPASAQVSGASGAEFTVDLDVSSSEIRRNVALLTTAAEIVNRAADFGLDHLFTAGDGRAPRKILWRLGRLWFVNLPVAALTHGAAHDAGHVARGHEAGFRTLSIDIVQWPWPVPIAQSVEYPEPTEGELPPAALMPVIGGGEQAAHVQEALLTERIYSRDRADYFDWVLLAYAQLDAPVYAAWDLDRRRFRDQSTLFAGDQPLGDFVVFALLLAEQQDRGGPLKGAASQMDLVRRNADRLRRAAWLNLADFALWAGVTRVAQYVITGERTSVNPTLSIGKWRLVPGAYSTLSSLGPEKGIDVRFVTTRYLPGLEVRWIDTPADTRLWAAGFTLRARNRPRFLPEVRTDLWQRPGRRAGLRLEAGGRGALTIARRVFDASFQVGYKSEGYLADAPMRAGLLGSFGVAVKF